MNNDISTDVYKVIHEILGLDSSWKLTSIDCSFEDRRVLIQIAYIANQKCHCPICKQVYVPVIKSEELQFRYFPLLGFQTYLQIPDIWICCTHHGMQKIVSRWEQSIQKSLHHPPGAKSFLKVI